MRFLFQYCRQLLFQVDKCVFLSQSLHPTSVLYLHPLACLPTLTSEPSPLLCWQMSRTSNKLWMFLTRAREGWEQVDSNYQVACLEANMSVHFGNCSKRNWFPIFKNHFIRFLLVFYEHWKTKKDMQLSVFPYLSVNNRIHFGEKKNKTWLDCSSFSALSS